jgi:hypothetical protein
MTLSNRDSLRKALCILTEKYLCYQNDDRLTRDVRMRLEEIYILLWDQEELSIPAEYLHSAPDIGACVGHTIPDIEAYDLFSEG